MIAVNTVMTNWMMVFHILRFLNITLNYLVVFVVGKTKAPSAPRSRSRFRFRFGFPSSSAQ